MAGCGSVKVPQGVEPVKDFDAERYLGKWHEIARLDHSFERGLCKVTAEYAMRDDKGISVTNRGFSEKQNEWKEAKGVAYFVEGPDVGFLKVSFFWPFYGSYIVAELDREKYRYALVCGPSKSYLWLLSRTPDMDDGVKKKLVEKARSLGFDTDKLIFVSQ